MERGMSAMMPLNIQGRLARGYSMMKRRRHCPGAVGTASMTSRPGCAFSCRSKKAELSLRMYAYVVTYRAQQLQGVKHYMTEQSIPSMLAHGALRIYSAPHPAGLHHSRATHAVVGLTLWTVATREARGSAQHTVQRLTSGARVCPGGLTGWHKADAEVHKALGVVVEVCHGHQE